jgi:mono/diheme cytochrome c family protein
MRFCNLLISILAVISTGCQSPATTKITLEAAQEGRELFASYNCVACHSLSGEQLYGPPLNNILNNKIEVIREGKSLILEIDRKYLIRSIREPGFEKVIDYRNRTMPVPVISADDTKLIVDYILYINTAQGTPNE